VTWSRQRWSEPPTRRLPAAAGFTLVEILLVLSLMALIAALVMPNVNSILRTISNEEPERILWDAVTSARELALTHNRPVWLRYDKERKALTWNDGVDSATKALPATVTLQFLKAKEGGATILLGGQLVETEEINAVRFFPDGTCDRFRAQLKEGAGAARILAVDPWTCAPVIVAEAKK